MRRWSTATLPLILAFLIACACAVSVWYATPWGAWGYSDSAAYVGVARNLAAGRGFVLQNAAGVFQPSLLTPPFYSLVLAPAAFLGQDPLAAARWVGLFLAFALPALLAFLAWRVSGRAWLAPLVALLVICFPPTLTNAASAMSEQLFCILGYGGLLCLLLPRPGRAGWIMAAVLLGLAGLTRYIGAAFILTGLILAWLRLDGAWSRRLTRAAGFAAASLAPLGIWLAWGFLVTHTLGARTLGVSPDLLARRGQGFASASLQILADWLPYSARGSEFLPPALKLGICLLAWTLVVIFAWRASAPGLRRLCLAVGLLGAFFMGFLAISYLLADVPPDLIPRIYSPLWPAVCLGLGAGGMLLAESLSRSRRLSARRLALLAWSGIGLAVLLVPVYYAPRLQELLQLGHQEGVGYSERTWVQSPVFALIRAELGQRPLISSDPALLLLYTGRNAYDWKEMVNGNLRAAIQVPPGQGEGRLHDLMRSGAALVLFPPRVELAYGADSRGWLDQWTAGLESLYRAPEAGVWALPESQSP